MNRRIPFCLVTVMLICSGCSYAPSAAPVATNTITFEPQLEESTPTQPQTSTPEFTATPARTIEIWDQYPNELMETNGECVLPCFWGIHPGETTWSEAAEFLDTIAPSVIDRRSQRNVVHSVSIDRNYVFYTFRMLDENNVLKMIFAEFQAGDYEVLDHFANMKMIFQRYGPPTQIHLGVEENTGYFVMDVMYIDNEQWFGLRYSGFITNQLTICPLRIFAKNEEHPENVIFSLLIQDPSTAFDSNQLFQQMSIVFSDNYPYDDSLDRLLGVSINEFYERVLEETDPCFSLLN